jgi:hypothetical protein
MIRFGICLILAVFSSGLLSQTIPSHKKKVYISPEGRLYIQKDLPIYLWLSISPDAKSEKYRLWSEVTKQYSNPMYLDTEGWNTVRSPWAVDTVTKSYIYPKRDIVFEVYADSKSPVTTIDYGDVKPFTIEGKMHIGSGANIQLTAVDALSGVEDIYLSIDGNDYKPYSGPIEINQEKEYRIKYYAVDNVGNVEPLHEIAVVLDRTAPVTKLEVQGDRYENILSNRSKIELTSDDVGSGSRMIYYSIDEASEKIYAAPILAAYLSQDDHTITYYAVDKVGNKEQVQKFSFYVDKTPPTIIEEIMGKSFFTGGKEYSSGRTRLKLTSFDNKAGVKEVRYSINGGEYLLYDNPVFLTHSSGELLIKSFAIDNVNNRSSSQTANEKTNIPYIDLTGPDLGFSFKGPKFETRDTIFISKNTSIILKGSDSEAGLNHIEYNINGSNPVEYVSPISVPEEGYSTIDFTGFDNVDNTSTKSFGIKIDNTGPAISHTFGTSWLRKEGGLTVYPSHTVLFLVATDAVVGFQRMVYSLNGGPQQEYIGIIKNLPKGANEILVTAFDKLNNPTELKLNFIIE